MVIFSFSAYADGRLSVAKFISSACLKTLAMSSKRDGEFVDFNCDKYADATMATKILQLSRSNEEYSFSSFLSLMLKHSDTVFEIRANVSSGKGKGFAGVISSSNLRYSGFKFSTCGLYLHS